MQPRGRLQPAHQGYNFQDIATAYMLLRSLTERYDKVIVDRKQVEDDRLDDLEVRFAGRRVRRQFKSSQNPDRALQENDFIAEASSLRIDRLVQTHVLGADACAEYRLCATWCPPDTNDLVSHLVPSDCEPTIKGSQVKCYRIEAEHVWPLDAEPAWPPLLRLKESLGERARAAFIGFCERFVIELLLPTASTRLEDPGPLELAVFDELVERVGIGRYPNQDRSVNDVAALAVRRATYARIGGETLTPGDVERALKLRTDFGRVAQAFPLDPNIFHDRPDVRTNLMQAALAGARVVLLAPPGSGKSWELTRLANDLADTGAIVARHYCYLEPGDDQSERRVTTDVFFGNLLAELLEAAPEIRNTAALGYSSGLDELESALSAATKIGRPVALIIDGLDHIARVRADAATLALQDTEIVERIAALNIPAGVALIVGSQPGEHLAPLEPLFRSVLLPAWQREDVLDLARLLGLYSTLLAVGIADQAELQEVDDALVERADGNPLYARYLCVELVSGLSLGTIDSPRKWLRDAPRINGQIATYYEHLYSQLGQNAHIIGDILGLVDFAVTEAELREIIGSGFAAWVPHGLRHLRPVLIEIAGQGGLRIFHESFRRFVRERMSVAGRPISEALAPVVNWLEKRGFFKDAKSFRFLLPALSRAGRTQDVFQLVGPSFVSDSLALGHNIAPMLRNIALAANLAGEQLNWPVLVRLLELRRAALNTFDGTQEWWTGYWGTFVDLFGKDVASERLLFDGKPTLSRSSGLLACSVVDDAGAVAPWREYLELPNDGGEGSAEVGLATVQGRLRTGRRKRVLRLLVQLLAEDLESGRSARELAARISRIDDVAFLERFVDKIAGGTPQKSRALLAAIRVGVADEYARRGDCETAAALATAALPDLNDIELAATCVAYGAPVDGTALTSIDPNAFDLGFGRHSVQAQNVADWIALLRLLARDALRKSELSRQDRRVAGEGWYRCWLRYTIALAAAEANTDADKSTNPTDAFSILTEDTNPFTGEPRACDLYAVRGLIEVSLSRGLRLLREPAQWQMAIDLLARVSHETASRMDREDGGPVPTEMLLRILLPFSNDDVGGSVVRKAIEREVERREHFGTYYVTHATYAMSAAQMKHAVGDSSGANEAWKVAATYLSAYGMHKDATIYELIWSAPSLRAVSVERALDRLLLMQPLTNSVVAHTDGRSTRDAPNAWLRSVLKVDPAVGALVLARSDVEELGTGGWPVAEAVRDTVEAALEQSPGILTNALLRTVPFDVDADNVGELRASQRLAPVERLLAERFEAGSNAFREVVAEIASGRRRGTRQSDALQALSLFAARHNLVSEIAINVAVREPRAPAVPRLTESTSALSDVAFPANPTMVDILAGLRRVSAGPKFGRSYSDAWSGAITSLSYRLGEYVDAGDKITPARILYFFARDIRGSFNGEAHPIAILAQALDVAGYCEVASVAYALAYTSTGSGRGSDFGGDEHAGLLHRAIELDRDIALGVLAEQVAYNLQTERYVLGMSAEIIERIATFADPQMADEAWAEAYNVIARRLPNPPNAGWFAELSDERRQASDLSTSLIALLLARVSDPRVAYKIGALRGVGEAIANYADACPAAFRWWAECKNQAGCQLLVLLALWNTENRPFDVSRALSDVLTRFAASPLWGVATLAKALLNRAGVPALLDDSRQHAVGVAISVPVLSDVQSKVAREIESRLDAAGVATSSGTAQLVASRMELPGPDEPGAEVFRERYELKYGRDSRLVAAAPVILRGEELIVEAINEALGLELAEADAFNEKARKVAFPFLAAHVGIAASRHIRPNWDRPASLLGGISSMPTTDDVVGPYAGWYRIALSEEEHVTSGNFGSGPVEIVRAIAGAVAVSPLSHVPDQAFPLNDGEIDWLWRIGPPRIASSERRFAVIAYRAMERDWLGRIEVLLPPRRLLARARLVPPSYGAPLAWVDEGGGEAIVVRSWRVLNRESLDDDRAELVGMDLIVRPDIYQVLTDSYSRPLNQLVRVYRQPVPQDDGG
jgi:hypothetical protein